MGEETLAEPAEGAEVEPVEGGAEPEPAEGAEAEPVDPGAEPEPAEGAEVEPAPAEEPLPEEELEGDEAS